MREPLDALSMETVARIGRQMSAAIDAATASVLATGAAVSEFWLSYHLGPWEIRLMRHLLGLPDVGQHDRGEVIARVWYDFAAGEVRYEGIEIGAGWVPPDRDARA